MYWNLEAKTNENKKYLDGDRIRINTVGTPSNGGSVTNNDYTITYTPSDEQCRKVAPSTTYIDTIPYTIIDEDGLVSNTATITVTVRCRREPPNAEPDYSTTDEVTPVTIGVLDNDSDPEDDPLSVTDVTDEPSFGRATPNRDGTITYTPDRRAKDKCNRIYANSFEDTFEYEIIDQGDRLTDRAIVTVTIECIRRRPRAVDDMDETDENTPITTDVLQNDSDPDDDETITIDRIIDQPDIGSVRIVPGGIEYTPGDEGKRKCRQIAGSYPDEYVTTYEYQIVDSSPSQLTDTAKVTITVKCVRRPPRAIPDETVTNEDEPVCLYPMSNDYDPENNEALTILSVSNPSIGSVDRDGDKVCYDPGQDGKEECKNLQDIKMNL